MVTETKSIILRIKAIGDRELKKIANNLKRVRNQTKAIRNNLGQMRAVFFGVFGALGIRQLTNMADSMQLLNDRIVIFSGSNEEAARTMDLLFDSANNTNTTIDSLANTYNRIALATDELGLSTEELIGFTETLQNTFRLSGSTTAEASAAAIQLSQGLASGAVRGQELRSVLEANVVFGKLLAKQFGISRGELIKFAETGSFTSDKVLAALSEGAIKLREDASKLGQTFGQTLDKAFNDVKKSIGELNKELKLNEKFADSVDFLKGNVRTLAVVFTSVLVPAIVAGVASIGGALAFTGVGGIIAGISAIVSSFFIFRDEIVNRISLWSNIVGKSFAEITRSIAEFQIELGENKFTKFLVNTEVASQKLESSTKRIESFNSRIKELTILLNEKPKTGSIVDSVKAFASGDFNKPITAATITMKDLNDQFTNGIIVISEYNRKLDEIEKRDLAKRFEDGKISIQQYREELTKLGESERDAAQSIGLAFEVGAERYAKSIGTMTSQLSGLVEGTFGHLENAIFDFTKGTEDAFARMTQAVLDDLLRIIIRAQIVGPLAQGLGAAFQTGANPTSQTNIVADSGQFATVAAKGNVFSGGNVTAFANGGILNSAVAFPMRNGTGLAGEAGPEAIVPLSRTSGGDLGVKAIPNNVIVNVNNNAGVEVDVQENTVGSNTFLDVTIAKAVSKAINSGAADKALSSNFGISRKGLR